MSCRTLIPMLVAMLAVGCCLPASAQEAAETAQVLSGLSSQGHAAHSLGAAIAGSINGAANRIGSPPNARHVAARGGSQPTEQGGVLPRGGNDLKDTGAPTYRTAGAGAITVSGPFIRSEGTSCVENCESEAADQTPQP